MRIIVFSDSHGNIRRCMEVIDRIRDVDMMIHLGDVLTDAEDLQALYPDIPVEYVAGNNDFMHRAPYSKVLETEGKRILITHGHLHRVKYEYDTIVNKAVSMKVDGVLFGHTHQSYQAYHHGMLVLNPGSISLPNLGKPSYGVIEIEKGKMGACVCNVD